MNADHKEGTRCIEPMQGEVFDFYCAQKRDHVFAAGWLARGLVFIVQPERDVSQQFQMAGKVFHELQHKDGAAKLLKERQVVSEGLGQLGDGDIGPLQPLTIKVVDPLEYGFLLGVLEDGTLIQQKASWEVLVVATLA